MSGTNNDPRARLEGASPPAGYVRTSELRLRNLMPACIGRVDQKWSSPDGRRFVWVTLPVTTDWLDGRVEWSGSDAGKGEA